MSTENSRLTVRIPNPEIQTDEVEAVCALCRRHLREGGEEYAFDRDRWDFLYRRNPEGRSFHSLLENLSSGEIQGHFGLFPLPLTLGPQSVSAGGVSNAVILSDVRNRTIPYRGHNTFPILPLIDDCVEEAFRGGMDLILAYSSIPQMIWRLADFDSVILSQTETWHVSYGKLSLLLNEQVRLTRHFPKWFTKIYAVLFAAFLGIDRLIGRGLTPRVSDEIELLEVERFDERFDLISEQIRSESGNILDYERSARYFNWRFESRKFRKFFIFQAGKISGTIVILVPESLSSAELGKIHDLNLRPSILVFLPSVLRSILTRVPEGFSWEHYHSSEAGRNTALAAAVSGFRRRPGLITVLKEWMGLMSFSQSVEIFYKIREETLNRAAVENSISEKRFKFSPLFYVPCPYF